MEGKGKEKQAEGRCREKAVEASGSRLLTAGRCGKAGVHVKEGATEALALKPSEEERRQRVLTRSDETTFARHC